MLVSKAAAVVGSRARKRLTWSLIAGSTLLVVTVVFVGLMLLRKPVGGHFVLVIAPAAAVPELRMSSAETVSDADEWHGDFVMADFFAVDAATRLSLVGRDVLTIALHQDGKPLGSFDFTKVGEASSEFAQVRSLIGFLHNNGRPAAVGSDSINLLRRALAGSGGISAWRKAGNSSRKGEFLIVATDLGERGGWQVTYLSFKR